MVLYQFKNGFSLIEILIVLSIIGILSSISFPVYHEYVKKAKRGECRAAILRTLQQQERFYTQNNIYLAYQPNDKIRLLSYSGENEKSSACFIASEICPADEHSKTDYKLSLCILVRAKPQYKDAEVNEITADNLGRQFCTGFDKKQCWK